MIRKLKKYWQFLGKTSFGRWLFSRILGYFIPYSGSISPLVKKVGAGEAQVLIKQHKRIANHLNSIHAIALINLGELTTGLALHFAMKDADKAILVGLNIEYLKKARGVITAIANISKLEGLREGEHEIEAILYDEKKDEVAKVMAKWLLGVKKV